MDTGNPTRVCRLAFAWSAPIGQPVARRAGGAWSELVPVPSHDTHGAAYRGRPHPPPTRGRCASRARAVPRTELSDTSETLRGTLRIAGLLVQVEAGERLQAYRRARLPRSNTTGVRFDLRISEEFTEPASAPPGSTS